MCIFLFNFSTINVCYCLVRGNVGNYVSVISDAVFTLAKHFLDTCATRLEQHSLSRGCGVVVVLVAHVLLCALP